MEKTAMTGVEAVKEFSRQYGPFAFGVASLLIIWFSIMRPELDRKQLDFDAQTTVIQQQHQIVDQMQETAGTLRETALILKEIQH